jgi:hypothetical protein
LIIISGDHTETALLAALLLLAFKNGFFAVFLAGPVHSGS